MYCTNCGQELSDKAVVCVKCGCATQNYRRSVVGDLFDRHQGQPVGDQTSATCGSGCCTAEDGRVYSPKSGILTLVLMVVFGGLGIHRMYVGKVASGIGMLCLSAVCYIPVLVWKIVLGLGATSTMLDFDDGAVTLSNHLWMWPWFGWMTVAFLPVVIWWIFDFIRLLSGRFTDGKGMPIKFQ